MRLLRNLSSAATLAVLLSACSAGSAPEPTQPVAITVEPPAADVAAGGNVAFAATVTGSPDTDIVWDVVEEGGGSVDADGLYTAPATAGIYRVRATAHADPQAFRESVVTVRPPVAVTLSPTTAAVVAGGTVTFTASVANATNAGVTWAVLGTSCGTITQAGLYTAPPSPATCTVVATSLEDARKLASATVAVRAPVAVAVTPSPGATSSCKTLAFTASVTGTTDGVVTWSVQEGAAGGAITAAGLYTAPATAGTYHVVGTSRADPTKKAISAVTVTQKILSVAVSPAQISLVAGATAQFTATVTTTCGTFSSTRTLTAPGG